MEKQNVVLIGMPGVGKSTVGIILAKVLGYEFVDSDLLIQKAEKRLLREIIADEGQDGFLKIENRVNASIETESSDCHRRKRCLLHRGHGASAGNWYSGVFKAGL